MDNYEYVIKQIFDRKKNNINLNDGENSSSKSIRSLNNEEKIFFNNKVSLINSKIKGVKENGLKKDIEEGIKEVNLTTEENNYIDDFQQNINKNKINKNDILVLNPDNYTLNPELINLDYSKPIKIQDENKEKILLKEKQKNNNNKKIQNNKTNSKNKYKSLNEILSYTQRPKRKNEIKNQLSTNSTTERNLKENLSTSRKIINQIQKKFERYNTESLMYEALKNYSQCKPLNSGFLERMQFYSIKKQTKNEILDYMVNQSKPKIKESERVKVFNHLIEDSNRRTEKYYKNEELKNRKTKSKKKFDEKKFMIKYKTEVIDKLREKEKNLQLLRNEKLKVEKEKEELILKDMRNRTQRVSKKKIEEISKRLYAEAMSFNTRKEMRNSFNDSDNDIFSLNLKKERNYSQLNLNTMNNSNSQSFIKKQKLYNRHYSQKNIHQPYYNKYNTFFKKNNNHHRKSCSSFLNKKNIKMNSKFKKFVPIFNAEKMVDAFFTKKNN